MAQRILKNNTANIVPIPDTGQSVPASGQLVIAPTDYGKYEGSSDVIVLIGDSTLTVNDGTFDLSITDGTRLIQGGFSRPISDGDDPTIKANVVPLGTLKALAVDLLENRGSTLQFEGSVGTIAEVFPDPAQTHITEFMVHCPEEQDVDNRLSVSVNGADFLTLRPSGHWAWTPKGQTVKQLSIKSNIVTGALYQIVLNLEEAP